MTDPFWKWNIRNFSNSIFNNWKIWNRWNFQYSFYSRFRIIPNTSEKYRGRYSKCGRTVWWYISAHCKCRSWKYELSADGYFWCVGCLSGLDLYIPGNTGLYKLYSIIPISMWNSNPLKGYNNHLVTRNFGDTNDGNIGSSRRFLSR